MTEPKEPSAEILRQEIFKPGNLVWGSSHVNKNILHSLATQGILPAILREKDIYGEVDVRAVKPNSVSFSMLSKVIPMANYTTAAHLGPKELPSPFSAGLNDLSIVVSKNKLLQAFPNKIEAIGDLFTRAMTKGVSSTLFDMDLTVNTVYDVPIRFPHHQDLRPHLDEVVVNYDPAEPDQKGITPDLWVAMVTYKNDTNLKQWFAEEGLANIPVFSPEGDIL